MENIYKNNLLVLCKLPINKSVYYNENTISIEDRYLGSLRYGNNIDKILSIVNISFLHYYNILLIDNKDISKEEIKELLTKSINGLETFKIYNDNNNINTKSISVLIDLHKKYLYDYENDIYAKSQETIKLIQDNINVIEEEIIEIKIDDKNTSNKSNKSNTTNFITNLFIGIRDSVSGFFISIYRHIFVY
jgi:hypothetical protein